MSNSPVSRMERHRLRTSSLGRTLIVVLAMGLLAHTGCLFRRHKAPAAPKAPSPPVRIAFLPLNVPQGNADLHWMAVAAAVLSADTALASPDIEPVPLWESIPAALQTLGNSRTVTTDIAELTAARLSARWSIEGEILSKKDALTMRVDFIPSKPTLVPFRYEKPFVVDRIRTGVQEAFQQFSRYLIVRELDSGKLRPMDNKTLRTIAEAVDSEYGWFSLTPKPGGSGAVVEGLARSNMALAKILFSPTLYPALK